MWLLLVRGEPFDRGPRRNVLLERVIRAYGYAHGPSPSYVEVDGAWYYRTQEKVVRPFRGLRRG